MDTQDKQSNNIIILSILPMSFFLMDTQDKRPNNILIQSILPRCFIMDTQDKRSNNILIQSILPKCFFNGHTGQTIKQYIHSKDSTHVFLEWTHRTNGQTKYLYEVFYPCRFLMDTQDKWTNNILIQSILPRCFYNGHTGQTDKQHNNSKYFTPVFLIWTHRTNGKKRHG